MPRERKYFRERPERSYTYATTLAIDWGSEAVRAKLYYNMEIGQPVDKLLQHVSFIQDKDLDRREVEGQFTSHIYPFDITTPNPSGDSVYPGNNRLLHRRSISSKLGMYAVVGISDEVSKQSPELAELRALVLQKPELKQTIRTGIKQMIYLVLRKVHQALVLAKEPSAPRVDAIALTIPAQWTIEFEEEYGELLNSAWERVFNSEAPQLIFLSEGQTNAHYAFFRDTAQAAHDRQYLSEREFFDIGMSKNAVLIIDAGGHSTNTSLVTLCQDDNQLEIRPDKGAIGGTALWAWQVLQLLKASWEQQRPGTAMPAEMENQILKTFYLNCPDYRDYTGAAFDVYTCSPNKDEFHSYLSPVELVQAFEDANAYAFSLIENGILELKALGRSLERIKIVIGGGSAQGVMWLARMISLCSKHQMEEPICLWQIDQIYEYARLAGGANYALAKAKSVAQFVDTAAFGLAVKKRFRGEDGWTTDWHYQATMLWARGKKWAKTIPTDGTEEFKIICQPEYDNPRPKSTIEPNYKAYDFLPIPCRKKGILQFDFEIDTDTDQLKLKIKHRGLSESGKTGRSTEIGDVKFDLWVPPGSRCLQIWNCVEDIESKMNITFNGDAADDIDVDPGEAEQPVQQGHNVRYLASQNPQAADSDDDDDMGTAEDQDGGGNLSSPTPLLQAGAEAPQQFAEDVEMGGMEDVEEIVDSITVAPMLEEATQSPNEGIQATRRWPRRGARVPTGIYAL